MHSCRSRTNDDLMSWWRTMKMGVEYVVTRGGPMAIGINQGGIFARAVCRRRHA